MDRRYVLPCKHVGLCLGLRAWLAGAVALGRAYAMALPSVDDHRQLFQGVAKFESGQRRALIEGYRKAGRTGGVVQAAA